MTSEKSYGSLLGISYYLEKDEWKKLIRLVAGIMVAGSTICFDYPSTDESKETRVNKNFGQWSRGTDESTVFVCGNGRAFI